MYYFEKFYDTAPSGRQHTTTIGEVAEELLAVDLPSQTLWSQLIEGWTEHKISQSCDYPDVPMRLVQVAAIAGLALRDGPSTEISEYLKTVVSNEGLASYGFETSRNRAFYSAIRPVMSRAAADMLAERPHAKNDQLLMIALGHSGVVPALQVAAYYNALAETETLVYPARYSIQKRNDPEPLLAESEVHYLLEAADGKDIVIFDDAVVTRATMYGAITFFGNLLQREVVWPGYCVDLRANPW